MRPLDLFSSDGKKPIAKKRSSCKICAAVYAQQNVAKAARRRQDITRQKDTAYRISKTMRSALNNVIKRGGGTGKTYSNKDYNYGLPEGESIIDYLGVESGREMPKNKHVDHIVPVHAFRMRCDMTDPFYGKCLNHYSNIRLLDATDNLQKGSKYKVEDFVKLLERVHNENGIKPIKLPRLEDYKGKLNITL